MQLAPCGTLTSTLRTLTSLAPRWGVPLSLPFHPGSFGGSALATLPVVITAKLGPSVGKKLPAEPTRTPLALGEDGLPETHEAPATSPGCADIAPASALGSADGVTSAADADWAPASPATTVTLTTTASRAPKPNRANRTSHPIIMHL